MDIGRAFSFAFEDEEWVTKFLLGAVIALIPIFGQLAIMGYAVAVIRNVKADEPQPLPTWENLGQYFIDGLMLWVALLIYALPLLILICPVALVWLLPALAGDQEGLVGILAGISGLVSAGLGCLALLYGILLALLRPVLQIRYAETGEIGACLRPGEVFRFLTANIGNVLISQLLVWLTGAVLMSVVGGLSLGLLVLPISFWLAVFSGHLYGQIGQQARAVSPLV